MSSEARHLHPAAMLIDAVKTIRRWVSAFVIPGVALLASRGFSMQTLALILLAALVAAAFAGLWGFLSWRATTYEVSRGALRPPAAGSAGSLYRGRDQRPDRGRLLPDRGRLPALRRPRKRLLRRARPANPREDRAELGRGDPAARPRLRRP